MNANPLDIIRQRQEAELVERHRNEEISRQDAIEEFLTLTAKVPEDIVARGYRDCKITKWDTSEYAVFSLRFLDIDGCSNGFPVIFIFNERGEVLPVYNATELPRNGGYEGGVPLSPEVVEDVTYVLGLNEASTLMRMLEYIATDPSAEDYAKRSVYNLYDSSTGAGIKQKVVNERHARIKQKQRTYGVQGEAPEIATHVDR